MAPALGVLAPEVEAGVGHGGGAVEQLHERHDFEERAHGEPQRDGVQGGAQIIASIELNRREARSRERTGAGLDEVLVGFAIGRSVSCLDECLLPLVHGSTNSSTRESLRSTRNSALQTLHHSVHCWATPKGG